MPKKNKEIEDHLQDIKYLIVGILLERKPNLKEVAKIIGCSDKTLTKIYSHKKKMTSEQDIKKIREMIEFLVKQKVSEKLGKLNRTERKIYELTGKKGHREIFKTLKIAPNTVSKIWQKLEKEGLLIKEGKKYRKVI